jgi:hypothetical protein
MAKPKKTDIQKLHAITAARNRYGLAIGDSSLREIVNKIQNKESEFVMTRTRRVVIHKVTYGGVEVFVAYDRMRHTICTFLLEEHIQQYQKEIDNERSNAR